MTDLAELVSTVRDRNSRAYIGEAVAAYRGRAYRSAVVATWVAVTYDIIGKLRELEVQGDPAATNSLKPQAGRRLQGFENSLLELAADQHEFISGAELTDLVRLREDRNRCAHPAFA